MSWMSLIIQHKYFILSDSLLEKMRKVIFLNYFLIEIILYTISHLSAYQGKNDFYKNLMEIYTLYFYFSTSYM